MIGEYSTDVPNVTASVQYGGLGFHYKWNMEWKNDILNYMETPPFARNFMHHQVTFSLLYTFLENFILPFSHDEVVHGKKSLNWTVYLRSLDGFDVNNRGSINLFFHSKWKERR